MKPTRISPLFTENYQVQSTSERGGDYNQDTTPKENAKVYLHGENYSHFIGCVAPKNLPLICEGVVLRKKGTQDYFCQEDPKNGLTIEIRNNEICSE